MDVSSVGSEGVLYSSLDSLVNDSNDSIILSSNDNESNESVNLNQQNDRRLEPHNENDRRLEPHNENSTDEDFGDIDITDHFDHVVPILKGSMDVAVNSCLLYYWQISCNVSDQALDRLLHMLNALNPEMKLPNSTKQLKTKVRQTFSETFVMPEFISIDDTTKIVVLDLSTPIKVILSKYHSTIIEYSNKMKSEDGSDVLSSKVMEGVNWTCDEETLDIFLLGSTDGGAFTDTTSLDIWPFQFIILNLPPLLRQRSENILLSGLISNTAGKPNLRTCLPELMQHFPDKLTISGITVNLHFNFFVCDLPALATVCNITQFNGKFSCPKCLHPGSTATSSKVWVFKRTTALIPPRTDEGHKRHVQSAIAGVRVFGVKGEVLIPQINFPSGYLPDSMHALWEGQMSFIIGSFTDPKLRHMPCHLSNVQMNRMTDSLQRVKIPPEYSLTKDFQHMSLWKAREYKFFAFHLLLPIILPHTSQNELKILLCCLISVYHMLYSKGSNIELMRKLIDYFLDNGPTVFADSLLRLNFHLLEHFPQQYYECGPLYHTSMFPFESQMKEFKSFITGTTSQIEQIAEKFVYLQCVKYLLTSSDSELVSTAFETISLDKKTPAHTVILNKDKALWKGRKLTTCTADQNLKTSSSLIQLKDATIGEIISFESPSSLHIRVLERQPYNILTLYVSLKNDQISRLLTTIFNNSFYIVRQSQNILRICLEDIACRCMSVPLPDPALTCIVNVVDVQEHS